MPKSVHVVNMLLKLIFRGNYFYKIYFYILFILYTCVYTTSVWLSAQAIRSPGVGLRGGCRPLNVGAKN